MPARFWSKGQTFCGFKHLNTLELVGISSHEVLPEISQCIKASSSSLKSLTLTLSYEMAKKSRKPNSNAAANPSANDDYSESDVDDDDSLMDPPTPGMPQPPTEADIREERLAQENILATVFDLQGAAQAGKKLEKKIPFSTSRSFEDNDANDLQRQLESLVKSLQETRASTSASSAARLEQLRTIKIHLDTYLKMHKDQTKKPTKSVANKGTKKYDPNHFVIPSKKKSSVIAGPTADTSSKQFAQSLINSISGSTPPALPGGPMSPVFGSASASGKSSSYGFPNSFIPGAETLLSQYPLVDNSRKLATLFSKHERL